MAQPRAQGRRPNAGSPTAFLPMSRAEMTARDIALQGAGMTYHLFLDSEGSPGAGGVVQRKDQCKKVESFFVKNLGACPRIPSLAPQWGLAGT